MKTKDRGLERTLRTVLTQSVPSASFPRKLVPAEAETGIHSEYCRGIPNSGRKKEGLLEAWIAAFAGMTMANNVTRHQTESLPKILERTLRVYENKG